MNDDNFEKIMRSLELKPPGTNERVEFTEGLDKRINRFQRRAVSFYRMSFGFGTAMVALIAISVISIWSSYRQIENLDQSYTSEIEALYDDYAYYDNLYSYDTPDTLNEGYVDLLMVNYIDGHGEGSSEYLVGDLSDEELQYLKNNLDVGDIL